VSIRPSRVWKDLAPEMRLKAAEAFWQDDSEESEAQQIEALAAIASRFHFRLKTVQSQPMARLARQLSQMGDASDAIATRALIAYHFAEARPLMAAFLDALGIAHDQGLITAESVSPPDAGRVEAAVAAVGAAFPARDVAVYLRTLVALDPDTWGHLARVVPPDA
jgi:hypothetical protein